jgi:hypothetical protein
LSKICLDPLRIAFDHINEKDTYIQAVRTVSKHGITSLSNYILYNYNDKPVDLYKRLKININLNKELGTKIYSFPMRYTPLNSKDRKYVGNYWMKRQIRGIQLILNVTKGIVMARPDFFKAAFGNSQEDFKKIILMPEDYILERFKFMNNGASEWNNVYSCLTKNQYHFFINSIKNNDVNEIIHGYLQTKDRRVKQILTHYIEHDSSVRKKWQKNEENY